MRTIKPEFFEDTKLAKTSVEARYLYAGLWCWADRQGIFEIDPQLIKKNIFPYDERLSISHVEGLIAQLLGAGIITIAHFEGKAYGLIPKFLKHQHPHHKEHVKYRIPMELFKSLEQAQGLPRANPVDYGFRIMDLGVVPKVEEQPQDTEHPSSNFSFRENKFYKRVRAELRKQIETLYPEDFLNFAMIEIQGYLEGAGYQNIHKLDSFIPSNLHSKWQFKQNREKAQAPKKAAGGMVETL